MLPFQGSGCRWRQRSTGRVRLAEAGIIDDVEVPQMTKAASAFSRGTWGGSHCCSVSSVSVGLTWPDTSACHLPGWHKQPKGPPRPSRQSMYVSAVGPYGIKPSAGTTELSATVRFARWNLLKLQSVLQLASGLRGGPPGHNTEATSCQLARAYPGGTPDPGKPSGRPW